ncbi:MAG: hypothetical protein Q8L78_01925 [Coxiellaceae bacterium]|nr:hypothetical protein [Coxiellaceae bacterium]
MSHHNRFSIFNEKSNQAIAKLIKTRLVAAEKKAEKSDAARFSKQLSALESKWLSEFGSAEPRFTRKPAATVVDATNELKKDGRHVSFKL